MLRTVLPFALAALAAFAGCTVSEEDACADDLIYEDGACRPKPAGNAGSASSSDGGAPPSDGGAPPSDGGEPPASGEGTFGDTCEEHTDCGSPTDYCAKSPVAPPYCTAAGCDGEPDICPEGWSCFDVSQFSPGEPWICMQPLE